MTVTRDTEYKLHLANKVRGSKTHIEGFWPTLDPIIISKIWMVESSHQPRSNNSQSDTCQKTTRNFSTQHQLQKQNTCSTL